MKTKKNPKFDLEKKRITFFLIGLAISLSAILLAFKGTSEVSKVVLPENNQEIIIEDVFIPSTKTSSPLPPPPPKMKIYDIINITDEPTLVNPDFDFPEVDDPIPETLHVKEKPQTNTPLLFAEKMPTFPGGESSLNRWLSRNIHYPSKAQQLNITGRVYLSFVVDTDGSIIDVTITRGVDELLNNEAKRVVSSMPKWDPGIQNGQSVKVRYNLFIKFELNY